MKIDENIKKFSVKINRLSIEYSPEPKVSKKGVVSWPSKLKLIYVSIFYTIESYACV